jgi:hypothetical protein
MRSTSALFFLLVACPMLADHCAAPLAQSFLGANQLPILETES